jgi:hypothetical protein
MATILMNVSKKKFNKCFTAYNDFDFHIVNENARKTLCNLFDALGNISSYNDYNAFMEKYSGFSKFNKCTVSRNLKTPIELSQGILVVVDSKTGELSLPTTKQLDWFLEKYQYSTSVIISDENEITEEPKPVQEPKKEVIILDEETIVEVTKVETPKSSGGFWSYFGWN